MSATVRRSVLTCVTVRGRIRRKEGKSSERSGIRTRQLCGFFVPGIPFCTAGRATDKTPRKGEEVHRLRSALNLPATLPVRVRATRRGFIELTQESFLMHPIALGAAAPVVSLIDGRAVTTSQNIAAVFGRQHDDVLRAIRNLCCSPDFNARNFAAVEYTDPKGERRPSYRLTRDGCAFLVMGFTGRKAAAFKEAYIDAFNKLEAEVAQRTTQPSIVDRWCLSFDPAGAQRLTPIPRSAVMIDPASVDDLRMMLTESIPLALIPDVLEIAGKRALAVTRGAFKIAAQGEIA